MEHEFLIDTCTVIKYLCENLPKYSNDFMDNLVDNDCKVSFITKVELLAWNSPNINDVNIRRKFLHGSTIYSIDNEIIDIVIEIRKKTGVKIPDAFIAATAIKNNFVLISTNENDFKKITCLGLKCINPEKSLSEYL